jgi:hypothetical protein
MGLSDDDVARIAYEANRALQYSLGELCPSPPWDAASEEAKFSYHIGIQAARRACCPCPRQQHNNWVQAKLSQGWVYGETRNEEERTHPNLVPHDELPAGEQLKDALFLAIVSALGSNDG